MGLAHNFPGTSAASPTTWRTGPTSRRCTAPTPGTRSAAGVKGEPWRRTQTRSFPSWILRPSPLFTNYCDLLTCRRRVMQCISNQIRPVASSTPLVCNENEGCPFALFLVGNKLRCLWRWVGHPLGRPLTQACYLALPAILNFLCLSVSTPVTCCTSPPPPSSGRPALLPSCILCRSMEFFYMLFVCFF